MSGDGTLVAIGTLAGIMEKSGDWHEIHIAMPGKQYPLKISTKKQELVELARAAGENVMEWIYTEVDSGNPNPHRPGSNYINRYFEGVAPVGATAPEGASDATRRAYAPDLKDRMIIRQTALKAAAELTLPGDDPALEVMKAARRFEAWVYRDIDAPPFAEELSEHDQSIPY